MKNKLFVFACAVIAIMLCACQPLNVSSEGSDVVTVGFKVSEEGISTKSIAIGNPLDNLNILYQYKAIPNFKPANGKEIVGATGDVWTDLPAVYNNAEFKMRFTKGAWTLYVRGIDKSDSTPMYRIAAPLKLYLSANTKEDIIFNMEADPEGFRDETGNGLGKVCMNILAQSSSQDGKLVIDYCLIGNDNDTVTTLTPTKIDGFYTYFIKDLSLASGNYIMNFTYHDEKFKTPMGPYLVQVITNKDTTVTGRIAHQSQFVTYFSTPNNEFNYRASFDETAVEESGLQIAQPAIMNKAEEKTETLQEAMEENNNLLEKINNKVQSEIPSESQNDANKEQLFIDKEKQKIFRVAGNINFNITTIAKEQAKEEVPEAAAEEAKEEVAKEQVKETKALNGQKKIGIIRQVVYQGEFFNLDNYSMGQEDGTCYYSLPEQLFKDSDEKNGRIYSPEHVITLKVTWSNGTKTLVAESEPITVLFIH